MLELLVLLSSAFYASDLDKLSSDDFRTREGATLRLSTPPAIPACLRRLETATDPEVRVRCGQAVRAAQKKMAWALHARDLADSVAAWRRLVAGGRQPWDLSDWEAMECWPAARLLGWWYFGVWAPASPKPEEVRWRVESLLYRERGIDYYLRW